MLSTIVVLFILVSGIFIIYNFRKKKIEVPTTSEIEYTNDLPTLEITSVLPFRERLELSWQPIKLIAESVIAKFSSQDQNKLIELGNILLKHGAKYIHIVDYSAPKVSYTKKRAPTQKLR